MDENRRRDYRSILPGTEVVYRAAPVRPRDRRYLVGVAENLSLGGLFISTRQPFPAGTLVYLDLYPAGEPDGTPFSARAVVRWRQLWREPRGMGLQFLEFANLAARPVPALLDKALAPPPSWRLPDGADPSLS
ncbi:MAG TPA: PilZ domain-containing protein [Thermoanaerobaculia bacterium]|nr:PilZ domain-containing protein [Thermoanaerobaculia bacterium]